MLFESCCVLLMPPFPLHNKAPDFLIFCLPFIPGRKGSSGGTNNAKKLFKKMNRLGKMHKPYKFVFVFLVTWCLYDSSESQN